MKSSGRLLESGSKTLKTKGKKVKKPEKNDQVDSSQIKNNAGSRFLSDYENYKHQVEEKARKMARQFSRKETSQAIKESESFGKNSENSSEIGGKNQTGQIGRKRSGTFSKNATEQSKQRENLFTAFRKSHTSRFDRLDRFEEGN